MGYVSLDSMRIVEQQVNTQVELLMFMGEFMKFHK